MTNAEITPALMPGENYEQWIVRRARQARERARTCPPAEYAFHLGELSAWTQALADALEDRIAREPADG